MAGFNAGPIPIESPGQLTTARIRQLMENAQKTIADRKAQIGFNSPASLPIQTSMLAESERAEKARRALELQAKIQAKLSSGLVKSVIEQANSQADSNGKTLNPELAGKKVTIDSLGRTIDASTGEEIELNRFTPTLKANIRAKKSQQFKQAMEQSTANKKRPEKEARSIYYDSRISVKSALRPKRNLSFYEPGKFIKQAQQIRIKEQLSKLQESVALAAKRTGIDSATKLATIQPKTKIDETQLPQIEWWDAYLLKDGIESLDVLDTQPVMSIINKAWITRLIEHPIAMRPPTHLNKPPEIPLFLTKREQKKLRRQNRLEAQKDVQEKVRLGLMLAPEPKVRLANLMRVLGTTAVQDPSKMEAFVRNQMDSRKRAHEKANADRKLSKEQIRYKRIKKIKEDTSIRVHVAVFRVKDLSNPSHRFKVETNANQLLMTGMIALHTDCNVVVVEGGRRQQYKFKRLMLNRIKWQETGKRGPINDQQESGASQNSCELIWEGFVKERAFEKIQLKACPTELYAREIFRKRDVEHYWDLAYSSSVAEEVNVPSSSSMPVQ